MVRYKSNGKQKAQAIVKLMSELRMQRGDIGFSHLHIEGTENIMAETHFKPLHLLNSRTF
jgi:hypothetical protein